MPKILTTLSVLTVLAIAQPVWAQETTNTQTEGAATTEAPAGDSTLAMGEEVKETPAAYVREKTGDWEIQCLADGDPEKTEDDLCQMYQLLTKDQDAIAEVNLFRLPNNEGKAVAAATIAVPLETLLTAQLTISVDGGKGKRYPFSFCNPIGCFARIGLTAEDITSFKKGAKATVSLVHVARPDQLISVEMSLAGFTDAFGKTSEITPP